MTGDLFLKSETGIALILSTAYIVLSYPIFLKVYDTSREIIDEEFHLRQGKHFCHGSFGIWDEKITTFPGLYLITALLLPKKLCSVFYMRALSLIFSAVNVFLIYKIRAYRNGNNTPFKLALESISLATLPPMYFFAHLYYTDIMSVTMVLALYYFWMKDSHGKAAIYGCCCILMRQTNVVWIAMFLGISALKIINEVCEQEKPGKSRKTTRNNLQEIMMNCINVILNFKLLRKCVACIFRDLWGYVLIICGFLIFVLYNGSIVVGDKSAHTASFHLPQLFYFSFFILLFGIGFVLPKLTETVSYMRKHYCFMIILIILGIIIVKYNTVVHPYLLSDNRHYTFYVWNRFYSKTVFRYAMVPIYLFALVCVQMYLKDIIEFQLMFHISLFVVLCLQRLLEIRYFIIPFVIFKLNVNIKIQYLLLEIAYYLIINFLVFNVFFTKQIYWSDRNDVQRLMW